MSAAHIHLWSADPNPFCKDCGAFKQGHAEIHTFGCGCQSDDATGIPISTCRRHDQRTREVKASAALMQMANSLDEAGKTFGIGNQHLAENLREAARYAVKAAKALIGSDDEG